MKRPGFASLEWLAVASLLIGLLLAMFQPTFASYPEAGDFAWPAILFRFSLFAPLCFITLGLLLFPLKIARWLFRWRVIRGFLWAVAILLTLVVLFYLEEDWRGKHAWDKCRHEWEAKGEKFDFASFIPPPVPDDQNFALAPIVASCYSRYLDKNGHRLSPENANVVNRLDMEIIRNVWDTDATLGNWRQSKRTNLNAWQHYYRAPSETEYPAATNIFPTTASPQTPAADVLRALSIYDAPLAELRQAVSQYPESRFPLNYENPSAKLILPHLTTFEYCGPVLELRAVAELAGHQNEKALADIKLLLHLSDSIHNEPDYDSQDSRLELLDCVLQPIWEGAVAHQWSDAQLGELDQCLGRFEVLADYPFAARSERAANLATIEFMRCHRSRALNCIFEGGPVQGHDHYHEPPGDFEIPFMSRLLFWLVPSGWFYYGEVTTSRLYQALLPDVKGTGTGIFSAAAHRAEAVKENEDQHPSPYNAAAHLVCFAFGWAAERFVQTQSSTDLARVACALERYRLAHNEYPENLDALTPQFIAAIPLDVINGQPLHYRRSADGNFVLYSVGWNEKDDGGTPVVNEGGYDDFRDFRKGDWVWQYPKS
jgi:hypothetical protein